MTVLDPLDGAVGVLVGLVGVPVGPVGPVGPPVGPVGPPVGPVGPVGPVDELAVLNWGGMEKGSRQQKIGLGLGPPVTVGLPDGPTEGTTVGPVGPPELDDTPGFGGSGGGPPFPN